MRIYLSVPLRNNRNSYLAKSISKIIQETGNEIASSWVLWPDPNQDLTPTEIYQRDFNAIKSCDLLVAEVSKPSIGVGMEIMIAKFFDKQVICVHEKTGISNLILGVPQISILSYENLNDLRTNLRSKIMQFNEQMKTYT